MKTLRAHVFNQRPRFEQVVGYLERNEPLSLDQPDRKATSFITSHFYLDDFVHSSEHPNPRPLQHTPLQAIPEDGFRTPAEATDEDVRLARRYQGGTRFVEDDLAGDPEAGALASNGQGPPSITDRLRSTNGLGKPASNPKRVGQNQYQTNGLGGPVSNPKRVGRTSIKPQTGWANQYQTGLGGPGLEKRTEPPQTRWANQYLKKPSPPPRPVGRTST